MGILDKITKAIKDDFKNSVEIAKIDAKYPPVTLEYVGGYGKIKGKQTKIRKGQEPNTLQFNGLELLVTSVEWLEQGERNLGKAVAGAIVGGVLTAGAGALVGAAIGGRKKDVSLAVVGIKDDKIDYKIYLRCDKNEFQKLSALL